MHRFIGYRKRPPDEYYAQGAANPPDEPQYEGVIYRDGTVAVRWLTEHQSHSVWQSWHEFFAIHGHMEYGTRFEWPDGVPACFAEDDTPPLPHEPPAGATVLAIDHAGDIQVYWRAAANRGWFFPGSPLAVPWSHVCADSVTLVVLAHERTMLVDLEPRNADAADVYLK